MHWLNGVFFLCLLSIGGNGQTTVQVRHAGAMMNLRQGDLSAAVMLDTLPKEHLFAIGPVEDLRGEIFVWDGRAFKAGILEESQKPYVEKVPDSLKAIFLVYANVPEWDTLIISEPLSSMEVLEMAIAKAAHQHGTDTSKPFPFLMFGKVAKGLGHIQWLDTNKTSITPTVGDDSKQFFPFENQRAQFVGFYSHHHKRIFTHHDAFMHIHYRLYTKYHAGHLDEVAFDSGEPIRLLLPKK
jgi:acetolactate decarboxylase